MFKGGAAYCSYCYNTYKCSKWLFGLLVAADTSCEHWQIMILKADVVNLLANSFLFKHPADTQQS